ncbi:MAG: asparaginase [Bacteroidales bacterium]
MMQRFNSPLHLKDVGLSFNTQEKGSTSVAGSRPFYVIISVLLSISLLLPTLTANAQQIKPRIVILATGGTIAGSAKSSVQASYNPGVQNIEVIISSVPEVESLANLEGIQVCNISSQNITERVWLELWKIADCLFKNDLCDGIVITHGTDTMEETAYFLNLTLRHSLPVVLTGSMRPATAISADGPFNLYNAVALAASPLAHNKGVMVTMNDYIYCANDVTKSNTVNTNAFSCPNLGPLGYMREGVPTFYRENMFTHTSASEFDISNLIEKPKSELNELSPAALNKLPKTEIILSYAFASGTAINAIIDSGAQGIIIAGVGHGNFNREILKGMEKAVAQNIAIVRSSRILMGGVDFAAEEYNPQYPVSLNKSPQKARILLMLALTKTKDPIEIQRIFKEY